MNLLEARVERAAEVLYESYNQHFKSSWRTANPYLRRQWRRAARALLKEITNGTV